MNPTSFTLRLPQHGQELHPDVPPSVAPRWRGKHRRPQVNVREVVLRALFVGMGKAK
jgi:hypothetical protein